MHKHNKHLDKLREDVADLIKKNEYGQILDRIDSFIFSSSNISFKQDFENECLIDPEMFISFLEINTSGICVLTQNKILYVNKAWCDLTEYSENDIQTIDPAVIIHPDFREKVKLHVDAKVDGENVSNRFDIKILTKKGKVKWIDFVFSIIAFEGNVAAIAILNDISHIIDTQNALKNSEDKFKELTELSPAVISIYTNERFLFTNPAWSNILGYSEKEALNIGPIDVVHPEMKELISQRFQSRLKGENPINHYDIKVLTKQGEIRWLNLSLAPVKYEGQTATLSLAIDVTNEKNAQEALKESENKYKSLIENLRQEYFFYRLNTNGIYEYISPSIEYILGYKPEDFFAHFTKFLTDNPINEEAIERTELALQGIQQLPFELEIYDIQKNIHNLEISETPLIDAYGNVIVVEGIAHDITSQKKTEEIIKAQLIEIKSVNEEINAINNDLERRIEDINRLNIDLRISENKFRTLVKNIPGVVYRCLNDKNWTMLFISSEVEILTGYPASDFIENRIRTFASIIHPEDVKSVEELIKYRVEKRKSYVIEYRIIHKDSSIRWVYEKGQYILEENSIDVQFLDGVIIDITEKKEAEEKLKESEKKLKALNAQKDRFFSLIAHDLRSPVSNFMQMSELLKNRYERLSTDQIINFLDNLHRIADSTFKLLENILTWSRSQLGKLEVKIEKIELYNLVNEVAVLFEENFKSKNITFINNLPGNLIVYTDVNICQTLFRNLISNAIKFSNHDGEIKINSKKDMDKSTNKGYCIISVEDNGVGIPEDKIDKIFSDEELYTTLGTENEKGTGLGLNLCKELIEKTGERIWLGSEEGKGTTFYFTLMT